MQEERDRESALKQQQEDQRAQNLIEKRARLETSLTSISQRQIERSSHLRHLSKEYKEVIQNTPLYKQRESEFQERHRSLVLEERKQALQSLREFRQPCDYSVVKKHQQEYDSQRS